MRRQQGEGRSEAGNGFERTDLALERLARNQFEVTASEYALLASLIAVVISGSVAVLGISVGSMWTGIADAVTRAT